MTAGAGPTTQPAARQPRRRRFARWRPGVALSAVAGALIASQLIALALVLAGGGDDAPDWLSAIAIVLADLILLGVVLAVARRGAEKLGPATLGIRRTKFWPAVGWMCVTYFAVMVFNIVWLLVVGTGSAPHGRGPEVHASAGGIALAVFGIAVVAPIVEEITFRGYLFPALTRWRGPWIGALLGALVFGAAHCTVYPPQLLPMMAVFGFGACLLYWFTGSLLPGIALHAMNNALVTGHNLGWSGQARLLMPGGMAAPQLVLTPSPRERPPQPP